MWQVKNQGMNKEQKAKEKDREDQKKAKEDKMKAFLELNKLLKPVQVNTKGNDSRLTPLCCCMCSAYRFDVVLHL